MPTRLRAYAATGLRSYSATWLRGYAARRLRGYAAMCLRGYVPTRLRGYVASKIGKKKYHRGHVVEGQWVFGGIEEESRKCFIVTVEDRSEATLLQVIKD